QPVVAPSAPCRAGAEQGRPGRLFVVAAPRSDQPACHGGRYWIPLGPELFCGPQVPRYRLTWVELGLRSQVLAGNVARANCGLAARMRGSGSRGAVPLLGIAHVLTSVAP